MKAFLVFILVIVTSFNLNAQIITTFAGKPGLRDYWGDGGPATDAKCLLPFGIVVDTKGNVFIDDSLGSKIRIINTYGIINTIAGCSSMSSSGDGGPASSACLNGVIHLAIDKIGNLYLSESARIRKIDTTGMITTIAGDGGPGYTGDNGPATLASIGGNEGITIYRFGNLYIADSSFNVIRKVDTIGFISTIAGTGASSYSGDGGLATNAGLGYISSLSTDILGNLYVGCGPFNIIRIIRPSGYIYRFAGCDTALGAFSGDGGLATDARLNNVQGIAVDRVGNLFFCDRQNQRIRKIDTTGRISTYAGSGSTLGGYGGDGGPAYRARLNAPVGITIDDSDNIYFADNNNSCIRKISKNGHWVGAPITSKPHSAIFPNPLIDCDYLNINNVVDDSAYRIVSLTGELLLSGQLINGNNQIIIKSFNSGIYILEIERGDGQMVRKMISKL